MLLYEDHKGAVVYAVAFSPDGSALATGAKDGSVFLRDASGVARPLTERGPNALPVHALVYAADGSALVIGGPFGWVEHRREGSGALRVSESEKVAPVNALAVLDDRTLVVGTGDRAKSTAGAFELWDLPTQRKREPHYLEPNGVRAVAACPASKTVAWATGHKKVCVWDVTKQKPFDFPLPKNCPALALSPDGKRLAAAYDYGVRVYDLEKRQPRFELKGHKGPVPAVVFSPDGETIATGSWDQTVRLWDAATGRERTAFTSDIDRVKRIGRVYCVAFAPDGLRLAAGGDLGSVVVWDME